MKKVFIAGSLGLMLFVGGCSNQPTHHQEVILEDRDTQTEEVKAQDNNSNQTAEFNGEVNPNGNGAPQHVTNTPSGDKEVTELFEKDFQDIADQTATLRGSIDGFISPETNIKAGTSVLKANRIVDHVDALYDTTEDETIIKEQLQQMADLYKKSADNLEKYEDTLDEQYLNKGKEQYQQAYDLEIQAKQGTNVI